MEWQDLTEKTSTLDMTLPLEEDMEIYTRVQAELIEEAPLGRSSSSPQPGTAHSGSIPYPARMSYPTSF